MKWFAKRFILKQVNALLESVKDQARIAYWREKVTAIVAFCNNLLKYLEDNKITDEECDKVIDEAKGLFA